MAARPPSANINSVQSTPRRVDDDSATWNELASTPCAFLWLAGESHAKIVPRDARLFVQQGELIREREAVRLKPGDSVILGAGNGRWSPTDEFTDVLVEAVEASHPEIVRVAREWRRALYKFRDAGGLTTVQLRAALELGGVAREVQTLDGWLELERASPIAPRGLKTLGLLAPIIGSHSDYAFNNIAEACSRLRRLRLTAGRALLLAWKGSMRSGEIGEVWVDGLLDRLRREVQVYDIEAVTLGDIPPSMLGWWLPAEMIGQFEVRLAESA